MNKPLSKLKLPFHIIKLLFRYGPSYFILSIFSIFISPIIALLGVYFPKIFIDRLENNSPYIDILIPILYFGLFLFLLYAINRILNYFKDKYATRMMKKLQLEVANYALDLLDVDKFGLDHIDRNILITMIEKFQGGPVGLETLAASISEDAGTLEDVYEPYLLKNGFIQRTPRGRVVTELAYQHLGIPREV